MRVALCRLRFQTASNRNILMNKHIDDLLFYPFTPLKGRIKKLKKRTHAAVLKNGEVVCGRIRHWSSLSNCDFVFDREGNILIADYHIRNRKSAVERNLFRYDGKNRLLESWRIMRSCQFERNLYFYSEAGLLREMQVYEGIIAEDSTDYAGWLHFLPDGLLADKDGETADIERLNLKHRYTVYYEYDGIGRLIRETEASESVEGVKTYSYDGESGRIKEYCFYENGIRIEQWLYTHTPQGWLQECVYRHKDYVLPSTEYYEYNDEGNETAFLSNGELCRSTRYENGGPVEEIIYDSHDGGKPKNRTLWPTANERHCYTWHEKSWLLESMDYTNAGGNTLKSQFFQSDGTPNGTSECTYTAQEMLESVCSINASGEVTSRMQWHYGYDARGNLVRYYCSENGRLDSYDIKTLEIEYFDAEEAV